MKAFWATKLQPKIWCFDCTCLSMQHKFLFLPSLRSTLHKGIPQSLHFHWVFWGFNLYCLQMKQDCCRTLTLSPTFLTGCTMLPSGLEILSYGWYVCLLVGWRPDSSQINHQTMAYQWGYCHALDVKIIDNLITVLIKSNVIHNLGVPIPLSTIPSLKIHYSHPQKCGKDSYPTILC